MAVVPCGAKRNMNFKAVFDGLVLALCALLRLSFLQALIQNRVQVFYNVPEDSVDPHLSLHRSLCNAIMSCSDGPGQNASPCFPRYSSGNNCGHCLLPTICEYKILVLTWGSYNA